MKRLEKVLELAKRMTEKQTKTAKQLQGDKYDIFCNYGQNASDLEQFKKDFNLDDDVTGLIGITGDGEVDELWATEDNTPWDLTASYEKVV